MLARVVLAADSARLEQQLRGLLRRPGVIVHAVGPADRLWEHVPREPCDLVIVSRSRLTEAPCDTVRLLRELPDAPEVMVLSGGSEASERADLLAAGCSAVLDPAVPRETFGAALDALLEKRREVVDRRFAIGRDVERPRLTDFVSSSPAMHSFLRTASRVVDSDTSLLVLGETGVGKERLARAIHAEGPRAQAPFVTVNCGALPEALLESELFGHVEGAFTGATRTRRGLFELAHSGTIFLDEIGDLPYHLQVKLLHVLQQREIQPIGAESPIVVDVRVMAATNRDLAREVAEARFRQDLYYRLNVVTLTIPPLRERREDVPELVASYIDHFAVRVGRDVTTVHQDALEALEQYAWPGNVRELINVIERAVLLCDSSQITVQDLPESISGWCHHGWLPTDAVASSAGHLPPEWFERPLAHIRAEVVARLERAYLVALLRATHGRVGETARRAGIRPRSLYDKMKQHGLRKEDFK